MNAKLTALWENYLTSGIRLADPNTLRRVTFLNLFEFIFVITAPVLGLFYFYIDALLLSYLSFTAAVLMVGAMLAMRVTKKLVLGGNGAVAVIWLLMIVIRWNSGGISAQGLILLTWVWNAVLILMAIFLTGYLWGAVWACLTFMESGLSVALFRSGHQYANLIPQDISAVYSLGFYLTGLLATLLFAFLFEKERSEAQMRENEKAEMLVQSRSYMENILERLPVPTFVLDNAHRVVQWNRACYEMTGVAAEEILGKKVWEGFSLDEDGSMADKILDNPDLLYEKYSESVVSMTESGSFSVETLLPRLKGGVPSIIKAAPIMDHQGTVIGAIQTIQEGGQPPEEPQNLTGLISGNIEESAFPVFKVDAKGKISAWNKACEGSLGFTDSQMIGKNALSFVARLYRRNFRDAVLRVLRGETLRGQEWKYVTRKGKQVYVLAKISPQSDPSGEIRECVVINTDITDLKLRMKKLGKAASEMKERYKKLEGEYNLLKSNVASLVRRKGGTEGS
jgi:PAS domain S-box-containing protein